MSRCETAYRIEDLLGQDWERRTLKLLIGHVACDDFVVLGHALDHEVFNELTNAQLELVERVCECGLDNLTILAGLLLDLLEK